MTRLTDEEIRAARAADRGNPPADEGGTPHAELLRAATERLAWVENLPHSGPRGVGQMQREALKRGALNTIAELEGKPAPYKLKRRAALVSGEDVAWPKGDPRGPLERNRP